MWVSIFDMELGLIIVLHLARSQVGAPILGHASLAHNTEILKIKLSLGRALLYVLNDIMHTANPS